MGGGKEKPVSLWWLWLWLYELISDSLMCQFKKMCLISKKIYRS